MQGIWPVGEISSRIGILLINFATLRMKAAVPWILAISGAGVLFVTVHNLTSVKSLITSAVPDSSIGGQPAVVGSTGGTYCKWIFSQYECRLLSLRHGRTLSLDSERV